MPHLDRFMTQAVLRREYGLTGTEIRSLSTHEVAYYLAILDGQAKAVEDAKNQARRVT